MRCSHVNRTGLHGCNGEHESDRYVVISGSDELVRHLAAWREPLCDGRVCMLPRRARWHSSPWPDGGFDEPLDEGRGRSFESTIAHLGDNPCMRTELGV